MILTNDFVFVHLPKTGGTFVRQVLTTLDEVRIKGTWLAYLPLKIRKRIRRDFIDYGLWGEPHRPCAQIPSSHQHKPILATLRNPYDRYVSVYEFRDWAIHANPYWQWNKMKEAYPHFPDLSFAELVYALNHIILPNSISPLLGEKTAIPFGWQTWQFVNFFFKDSEQVLPKLDPAYIQTRDHLADMYPIHFICTHNLNQELYDFLLSIGYQPDEVAFILNTPKIRPEGRGRSAGQAWQTYYTPELKQYVRQQEDFLFTLYPEFDV